MADKGKSKGLKGEHAENAPEREEKELKRTTRREFVKGTAVGAAGVAAAGVLAGCAPAATPEVIKETVEVPVEVTREVIKEVEVQPWLPEKWDYEADVVVVGTGGGFCAAIAAHDAGAKVIVLEKDSVVGGNVALSTAYIAAAGTQVQPNSPEEMINAMVENAQAYGWEDRLRLDLLRLYAENSGDTLNWLMDLGLEVESNLVPRPAYQLHSLQSPELFRECWEKNFQERGIEVLLETQGVRLIATPENEVLGLEAERDGKKIYVQAKRGVILATGGYQGSPEMKAKWMPRDLAEGPYMGTSLDTGDGHIMALALGADMAQNDIDRTDEALLVHIASLFAKRIIAVNVHGTRFMDECGPYRNRVLALREQPEGLAYWIFDSKIHDTCKLFVDDVAKWTPLIQGDTLEDLAVKLGMDAPKLKETVDTWNGWVKGGMTDPEFGRVIMPETEETIETAPFYALKVILATGFSYGGLNVNTKTQVIDVFGSVVPRLYAIGDLIYGISPAALIGGVHIGSTLTLGRIAGQNAAAETPWE